MTAREAYDADAVFRALVTEWVDRRRCPAPLVDRCLDFDMPDAAECARWAAGEPDRPQWQGLDRNLSPCGPYPAQTIYGHRWYWMNRWCGATSELCPFTNSSHDAASPLDAILLLLDNFRLPAEVPV